MEKKRSRGITNFAWFCILIGAIGIFNVGKLQTQYISLSKLNLFILVIYTVGYSIMAILAGINVLKLKVWSRKLIVSLAILGILSMVVLVPLRHKYIESWLDGGGREKLEELYDNKPEEAKARMGLSKEEYIVKINTTRHVMIGISEVVVAIGFFSIIIFFTCPKVKEQFK